MTEATWVAISALASAAVAVATAFLAKYTYDLAKETRKTINVSSEALNDERLARKVEESRHMDYFMPHIALLAREEILELSGRGIQQRFLALYAKNIGSGFARNISVAHANLPNAPQFFVFNAPIALGAGEEVRLAARQAGNPITFMGYSMSYEDAFGRRFESRIRDNVNEAARYEWTSPTFPQR